ncbi:MAG: hypothetical protein M1423_00585 [Acidobacteria bacterium]|nr:hypothetical protein [Acidobacteriota bacterium]
MGLYRATPSYNQSLSEAGHEGFSGKPRKPIGSVLSRVKERHESIFKLTLNMSIVAQISKPWATIVVEAGLESALSSRLPDLG